MFLKRAFYSLRQKMGRSVLVLLLFLVLFSITLGLLIAFLSFQSEVQWMQRTLGSSVTLTPVSWRGVPEGSPEGSEIVRNGNISFEDAKAFVDSPLVETYNYVANSFPVDFEGVDQVVGEDVDQGFHEQLLENEAGNRMGDGYLFPISDSSRYEAFTVYGFQLVEGSHFSPEDETAALISQELAEQNGLQVGDTITLSQANYIKVNNMASIPEDKQALTLTICGLFTGPDKDENGYTYFLAEESPTNYVFASFATASPFVDYPSYDGTPLDRVTAYLKDPGDMDEFLRETQGKLQIEKTGEAVTDFGIEMSDITLEEYWEQFENQPTYELTSDRELYDMVGKPLEQTRDLMGLFLAALLAASLVILLLVVALQVRSRKREFAILLSLGETRGKVIGQVCVEVFVVLVAAAVLGGVVGTAFVAPAAEQTSLALLSTQVENTQADREALLEESGSGATGSFTVPGDFVNSRSPGKAVVYQQVKFQEDSGVLGVYFGTVFAAAVLAMVFQLLYILRVNPARMLVSKK